MAETSPQPPSQPGETLHPVGRRRVNFKPELSQSLIQISRDRSITPGERSTQLAYKILRVFRNKWVKDTSIDLPSTDDLIERYYPTAGMIYLRHTRQDVGIMLEIIGEDLEPFHDVSPVPIAAKMADITGIDESAHIANYIVLLWAADYFGIDIPPPHEEMQKEGAKYVQAHGATAYFTFRQR